MLGYVVNAIFMNSGIGFRTLTLSRLIRKFVLFFYVRYNFALRNGGQYAN